MKISQTPARHDIKLLDVPLQVTMIRWNATMQSWCVLYDFENSGYKEVDLDKKGMCLDVP